MDTCLVDGVVRRETIVERVGAEKRDESWKVGGCVVASVGDVSVAGAVRGMRRE